MGLWLDMSGTSKIGPAAVKARLLARRTELLGLTESSSEARRPVELDQTRVGRLSRMDALQSQAMSLETAKRLELDPTTPVCIDCAQSSVG
jgi:DnaK suppressor protein